MKVTSLKDMENYIYSSVILPLKRLNVSALYSASPLTGSGDRPLAFEVVPERIRGDFQYEFQRNQARDMAHLLVLVHNNTPFGSSVAADYDPKRHTVIVYSPAILRGAHPSEKILLNKFIDAFYYHEPFTDIQVLDSGERGLERWVGVEDLQGAR